MEYTDGYKYQIRKDMQFRIPVDFAEFSIDTDFISLESCILTIRKGYAYDGASGPTFDTRNSMRGSAFHDAMYQLFVLGLLPRTLKSLVDELFRDMLRQDGMSAFRSAAWHRAVKRHGMNSTIRNKDILIAP
jgi:hypothetical protein